MWKSESDVPVSAAELRAARAEAQRAAQSRDSVALFEALCKPGLLDGCFRLVRRRWSRVTDGDVESAISKAVDQLCESVHRGKQIDDVVAYVFKAASVIAGNQQRALILLTADDRDDGDSEGDFEERAVARLQEAASVARRFLPRLGRGQVVAVMRYVIECIENNVPCTGAPDIGEALGIPTATAATLLWRGLERLRKHAAGAGYGSQLEQLEPMVGLGPTQEFDE